MTQVIQTFAIEGRAEGRGGRVPASEPGGGAGGFGGSLVWSHDPDEANVATFEELMVARAGIMSPITVYVGSGTYNVPAGDWDVRATFRGLRGGDTNSCVIDCAPGTTLREVTISDAIKMIGRNIDRALLVNTPNTPSAPPVYSALNDAVYTNLGTYRLIDVPANGGIGAVFAVGTFAGYETGNPHASFAELGANETLLIVSEGEEPQLPVTTVIGVAGTAVVNVAHDGTLMRAFEPGYFAPFGGTVNNLAIGQAGGAGTTAFRPAGGPPTVVWCMYFDTTIGKPVFWTGAAWVDAAGAPA